jgi:hypothetical protein
VSFMANRKHALAAMVAWMIAGGILVSCGAAALSGISTGVTPGSDTESQPETWILASAPQPSDPLAPSPQSTEEPPTEEPPTEEPTEEPPTEEPTEEPPTATPEPETPTPTPEPETPTPEPETPTPTPETPTPTPESPTATPEPETPTPTPEPPADEPPAAADVTSDVDAGGEVSLTLQGSDAETCELNFNATDPANGTLSTITDQSCQSGSPHADTAVLTYIHDGGDATSDSFTYEVCDEAGSCATATVSITILPTEEPPPDEPPTAIGVDTSVDVGGKVLIDLQATDAETCELEFTYSKATHGSVATLTNHDCEAGTPNSDTATVQYTHDGGNSETDSFTYEVCDEAGQCATATINLTMNVAEPPDAEESPTAQDVSATIDAHDH